MKETHHQLAGTDWHRETLISASSCAWWGVGNTCLEGRSSSEHTSGRTSVFAGCVRRLEDRDRYERRVQHGKKRFVTRERASYWPEELKGFEIQQRLRM